jgi:predicted phosphoribosyltransferase
VKSTISCASKNRALAPIGYHYADFAQVSDDDVREMLGQHPCHA